MPTQAAKTPAITLRTDTSHGSLGGEQQTYPARPHRPSCRRTHPAPFHTLLDVRLDLPEPLPRECCLVSPINGSATRAHSQYNRKSLYGSWCRQQRHVVLVRRPGPLPTRTAPSNGSPDWTMPHSRLSVAFEYPAMLVLVEPIAMYDR